jgi:adenylylsulfate kinase-like enzyme
MYSDRPNLINEIIKPQKAGRVVWITGLSGAGKSVLAAALVARLRMVDDEILLLDGDELREVFGATSVNAQNYGRDKRMALAMQYAHLCNILAKQGFTVVIATISLFKEVHEWNRANLQGYFEAYLRVPLEELRRRDPKGIYRRFDAGEIKDVAGLDLPIDEPEASDWIEEFLPGRTVDELANELLTAFLK